MMGKKKYAMAIDLDRCIGCHACAIACKSEMGVPLGIWYTHVRYLEKGKYPHVKRYYMPLLCNHCDEPACLAASKGAVYKRPDGIVLIDQQKEEDPSESIEACPYGNFSRNPLTKKGAKCTYCAHRVDKGLAPACVNTCLGRARIFGDINDPKSEISRYLAIHPTDVLKPWEDTGPNTYYVSLERDLEKTIRGGRQFDPYELEAYWDQR